MKKLTLEWIPNAYTATEKVTPKNKIAEPVKGDHPIVRSTTLYQNKRTGRKLVR
ncbi:hypothetical protein [Mucilaginibacter corticis]|uniref:hypothetical protein n=1 Tax=Mucilaginibacter corticis TaxID=2597670 RepID=UPI001642E0AF|nr:hypothetical protein [Mucilaginibacter corticis]